MSMDEKPTEGRAEELTVENLTNSLAQIEIWIKAVRKALETMDPK